MDDYQQEQAKTIIRQIGANILAISGGPWTYGVNDDDCVYVSMKAGSGYRVEVVLTPMDLYRVTRVFVRAGKRFVKGTEDAWAGDVGEVAYRASCYVNVEFGEEAA